MFDERKVTHMAAYLLLKGGGRMSHFNLVKLLYLSERQSLLQRGLSMSGDDLESRKNGPILSKTLDLIDGDLESQPGGWDDYISGKENHEVFLRPNISIKAFDKLSKAETKILDDIWEEFGHMKRSEISQYTHDNCPEWEDPGSSSSPIPIERIFKVTGHSTAEAEFVAKSIKEQSRIDRIFASP